MTKIHVSPSCTFYALSTLSDEEIISLLDDCPPSPEAITCPEDEPMPTIGEIRETESRLFTQIVAAMSGTAMPYGQAVLLVAIYATTVEDRVRLAMMS